MDPILSQQDLLWCKPGTAGLKKKKLQAFVGLCQHTEAAVLGEERQETCRKTSVSRPYREGVYIFQWLLGLGGMDYIYFFSYNPFFLTVP